MKSYKQMMKEANDKGNVKTLTPKFVKWTKEGQSVLGELRGMEERESKEGDGKFYQYLFDTDEGPVKFQLGSVGDSEVGSQMRVGGVYYIEYHGQEKTNKGYNVNKFSVVEIDTKNIQDYGETDDTK